MDDTTLPNNDNIVKIMLANLDLVLDRFECDEDYPFLNTKVDIFTGKNLTQKDSPIDLFGKETIYPWIQGRGMEALAGHGRWISSIDMLPASRKNSYHKRITATIAIVSETMEKIRAKHGGLSFWIDRNGIPFDIDKTGNKIPLKIERGKSNFSDLFYAKGLLATADFLGEDELLTTALNYLLKVTQDIDEDRFYVDQKSFDTKNRPEPLTGRHTHGPRMIALGGLALAMRICPDDKFKHYADRFLRHILERHINLNGHLEGLQPFDFTEFINDEGQPWLENGNALSDPGHALEFVGLGMKLILTCEATDDFKLTASPDIKKALAKILTHSFKLGWQPESQGICKLYSLTRRTPLNFDMPWWSLPETMRAAALVRKAADETQTVNECNHIIDLCANSFTGNYVNPKVSMLAYQTRDRSGTPVKTIPATPDLDPCYHTGLSLIDYLQATTP